MNAEALRTRLRNGACRKNLSRLYCCPGETADAFARRFADLVDTFENAFGPSDEIALFSAPGRTEIGGNHTDHQHGCVLTGAVNRDIIAAAAANQLGVVRLQSGDAKLETVDLSGKKPERDETFTPRSLVRGIAVRLEEMGHAIGGVDICASSDVPVGSGLSSSAAFEILIGNILNSLFCRGSVPPAELAKAGRYAENHFFGKPCGLMDQLASSLGGLLFIDFRDPETPLVRRLNLDLQAFGYAMCIVDSGADHAGMSGIYAEIPAEMEAVAACFGQSRLREVEKAAFLANLPAVRKKAGDRAILRSLHFFNDTRRAREEEAALREGRFADFLALFNASRQSSWMYLQNVSLPGSSSRQEVALALALCGELLGEEGGFRVHGGGFAGTVQAFVPLPRLADFVRGIEAFLGQGACHVLYIRGVGGIRLA
ncbi:MAG: galactokinase [Planctomycetota bacterium]|jgi:galactokinase|nr:galactokinase [Planctomycetota bacterium]